MRSLLTFQALPKFLSTPISCRLLVTGRGAEQALLIMYYFAFVVPPHRYSSSMLKGALPSGKHCYDSQLGSYKSFKTLLPLSSFPFLCLSFTLSWCPHVSISSSFTLLLREHLTDVLFKDEKHGGGESKSKHKNIHKRTGKTLLYTHTNTHRVPKP